MLVGNEVFFGVLCTFINLFWFFFNFFTTAERLIAARSLVTGKNKPVTGNDTSDGRVSGRR
jgi:hypothetical protein